MHVLTPMRARARLLLQLVESAWEALDPIIPESFSKMMLRSFGWFVIERTR